MRFLSDQELFSNVNAKGIVDLTPYADTADGKIGETRQIEWQDFKNLTAAQTAYTQSTFRKVFGEYNTAELLQQLGIENRKEVSADDAMQQYAQTVTDSVEEYYQKNHIGGFLDAHGKIGNLEYDYFDDHPLHVNAYAPEVCGGAFSKLNDILFSFFRPEFFFWCLLMTVIVFLLLSWNLDGYIGVLTSVVMIATPLVYLGSGIDVHGLCHFVCSPLVKVGLLIVSVLAILSRLGSPVPTFVMILRYYYMICFAAQLIDIVMQLFKCGANRKKKQEYCRAYERYAPQIHRYIRYHVLWWNHKHPGEPMHASIEEMSRSLDHFTNQYKKFR